MKKPKIGLLTQGSHAWLGFGKWDLLVQMWFVFLKLGGFRQEQLVPGALEAGMASARSSRDMGRAGGNF